MSLPSSSTATVETNAGTDLNENKKKQIMACPICYHKLIWNSEPVFSIDSTPRSILYCDTCEKSYSGNETHLDLTVTNGEYIPPVSELFRLRLISFVYERGWRLGFEIWSGFPGPQKEFEMMKGYFDPVIGGCIIDASCGSGMFSRLFAKSGLFSLVIALDFSENMLNQTYNYIKQDEAISNENLFLVRADIARLPFASSSIDAVHAGAALHCWPSPSAGVAEISRILRPGGVFVATTFIIDGIHSYNPFLSLIRKGVENRTGVNMFLCESELEDMCSTCGLVDYTCIRNRRFIMISARKPN